MAEITVKIKNIAVSYEYINIVIHIYVFFFSPRPIYQKSWLWTKEEAALHIQRYVRGWLIRKRIDVQEMRQFWKVLE